MKNLANEIVAWLRDYAVKNNRKSWVVGVSGGVDSALVSTLCAMTGLPTHCVVLPCQTKEGETARGRSHISWLQRQYDNVYKHVINLTSAFEAFKAEVVTEYDNNLAYANAKSRLRMIALYQIATCVGGLVVGTGNKVEDFGVGFFTKYGDGGVDISPIADLTKTEVRAMCKALNVLPELTNAVPTDGLWADGRSDEDALGATYPELEWAMDYIGKTPSEQYYLGQLTERQVEVLNIYNKWHKMTAHKLAPIPTFKRS